MYRFSIITFLSLPLLTLPIQAQAPGAVTESQPQLEREQNLARGYESLLREYAQLRRVEEAGEVGGAQDGLQRMEIDGLVVDETQTKLARDFYAEFFAFWQAPEGAANFTIVIQEQPVPNVGTRVLVRVNDEVAYQTQLQPREELIQYAARQAAFTAYRFLQALAAREEYVY